MNIRSGRGGRALEVVDAERERLLAAAPRAGSAARRPWLPWRQVSPPSSVSQTPTAEIAEREPLRLARPRDDRVQAQPAAARLSRSGRVGCSHSARLSSQVAPPSRLSNSTPGSPPAYSVPSSSPATITQMRSSAASPPSRQRDALGLLPLARRVVGEEDLRAVERRGHRGEHAAAARVAHRVLDRLARERARGDRERAPGLAARARTAPSSCRPAARSCVFLLRSRAGRRRGRPRRPASPRFPARR